MTSAINSIGFIVDGNRRWAVEQGLNKLDGHKYGFDRVTKVIEWASERRIKQVCFYVFSTENWNRSAEEVNALMKLFELKFKYFAKQAQEKDYKIKFIGRTTDFSVKLQKIISDIESKTSANQGIEVFLAASYGGRVEIIDAIRKIPSDQLQTINENSFERYLTSVDLMDPQIIIRTGGNRRLSNFLLWKSSYAELYFVKTKWPDFSETEFDSILDNYRSVKINKGK